MTFSSTYRKSNLVVRHLFSSATAARPHHELDMFHILMSHICVQLVLLEKKYDEAIE